MRSPGRQLEHAEAAPAPRRFPIRVLAVGLERPANVGGLLRVADAFGLERVLFAGPGPSPAHPKARRAARRADTWVPHAAAVDPVEAVDAARDEGLEAWALERTERSEDVGRLRAREPRPLLLIVGSERGGVPAELLARCHGAVHVPMYGRGSSMNVTHAASVAAHLALQPFLRR